MDILERLKQDHRRQEALAGQLVETSGDSKERRTLFEEFKTEAEAHANAEEQVFYAALIEEPDSQEKARHSVSEHKEAADLLEELTEGDMSSSGWLQKFKKLKEALEHHIEEEENEVFALARKVLPDDSLRCMVGDFNERKEAEM